MIPEDVVDLLAQLFTVSMLYPSFSEFMIFKSLCNYLHCRHDVFKMPVERIQIFKYIQSLQYV